MTMQTRTNRMMRFGKIAMLVGVIPVALAGCEDFLQVTNPGSIPAEDLDNPELLAALLNLPEAAGIESHDNFVLFSGMIGSDLMEYQTRATELWQDWGLISLQPNSSLEGQYDGMAQDSWHVKEGRRRIESLVSNPESHWAIARAYFWDGHLQASRADMFEQITFDSGPPHTPLQVYEMSLELLEKAVQVGTAAGEDDYVAAAHGTMARVDRSLFFETGDAAHLASAAQHAERALQMDPEFRLDARFIPPGKSNSIYNRLGPNRGLSPLGVETVFGEGWIDPVTNTVDPRIGDAVSVKAGTGPNGDAYFALKYESGDAPIPVSRWQEATLIIAENDLQTGNLQGAVSRINEVRSAANRPPFASSDAAEIRRQIIYERKTEFFLEGRNWQDHRYYGEFPARWSTEGRQGGLDRRVPVSQRERNANENF